MKKAVFWASWAVALAACTPFGGRYTPTTSVQPESLALYNDCANALVVGLRWDTPSGSGLSRHTARYTVSRNGVELGATSDTNFSDTTVDAGTTYEYSVSAALPSGKTVSAGTLLVSTPARSPAADPPYCHSRLIDSIEWDWAGGHTEPDGSDLWPVTWGKDGHVYTFFGDGGGFGGDNYRGRVSFGIAMMTAKPPLNTATVKNIYGGYQASHPSTLDGKAGAIIAVGHDFYTLGGLYTPDELRGVSKHKSGAPKRIQLGYSRGNAHSWHAASWLFCSSGKQTPDGAFCPSGFINFGRGNRGAPDNQVYLLGFANTAAWWQSDDGPEVQAELQQSAGAAPAGTAVAEASAVTYLARVPKSHVLEHEAYQYFAGLDSDGKPIWSSTQGHMKAIFTDRNPSQPGCGGRCFMASPLESVVYDSGIQRYIATAQGEYIGQTSFYEAPHPWGPWTTVSYNNIEPPNGAGGWANLGMAGGGSLGVHAVNAWTSKDGLSLWFTYSSDGKAPADALFPPAGTQMDSFNLVGARLILATTPDGPRPERREGGQRPVRRTDLTSSGEISQFGAGFLDSYNLGPLIFGPAICSHTGQNR